MGWDDMRAIPSHTGEENLPANMLPENRKRKRERNDRRTELRESLRSSCERCLICLVNNAERKQCD
jgi:hypothetical protein